MISVIIPCYNVGMWIDRCMQSVISQTIGIENMEIICVDDCSQDGTVERLIQWEKTFPDRITVVECADNGRQGRARNIGLSYATGQWICFVDADDWIEKDYLKKMTAVAEGQDYEIVCCGYKRDFSKELKYLKAETTGNRKDYSICSVEDRREFIIHPPLRYSSWSKIIKRSFLIENKLFFPDNITYEDVTWGSLVHLYCQRACVIEDKLYHYFVNEESSVLKTNSNHHLDCLTAQTLLWREYKMRGFMDLYKDELELEHIYSAYLPGIKVSVLRYEIPDYNFYLLLRELMLDRIGNYKENPYIKNGELSDYYMLLLSAMDNQLTRVQFMELAERVKEIGI